MTDIQVQLIQLGWKQILPQANAVAMTFYQHLFTQHPEFRRMFPRDFRPQIDKMSATLKGIVLHLDCLDVLLPQVQLLGIRHAYYKAEPAHYKILADSLLHALEVHLKNHWSQGMADAWYTAYWLLADTMMEAQTSVAARKDSNAA